MNEHHIAVQAILAAREGLTGDKQAAHYIESARRDSRAYLAGDERESANSARLLYRIGMLEAALRQVCHAYACVVEPADVPVGEASELDPAELDAFLRETNDAWADEKHVERMEAAHG
jgi:hypothetical protein